MSNLSIGRSSNSWLSIESSVSIPAYSIVQISGGVELPSGVVVMTGQQPDGTGTAYYPNGPVAVYVKTTGEKGYGTVTTTFPAWVAYTGGTPVFNEVWGPVAGSWKIQSTGTGFRILYVDTEKEIALVTPQTGSGVAIPGTVVCYRGDGWYNVTVKTPPDSPPLEGCVPDCDTEYCLWTWSAGSSTWSKTSDGCTANCSCSSPGSNGTTDGETCKTLCSGPSCTGNATWTWDATTETWSETTACTGSCTSVAPTTDGTYNGETTTSACVPSKHCDAFTDPEDLCCPLNLCPPACPEPAREGFTGGGDTVQAYQTSQMTVPAGTDVMMLPMGQHYAIVDWEDQLLCLQIPSAISCCDDGSIKITSYSRAIVRGIACSALSDPC